MHVSGWQEALPAQARALQRTLGVRIDRTERVANSLGHLMGVLQKLMTVHDSGVKVRALLSPSILWCMQQHESSLYNTA